jgi:hypothetical protein
MRDIYSDGFEVLSAKIVESDMKSRSLSGRHYIPENMFKENYYYGNKILVEWFVL